MSSGRRKPGEVREPWMMKILPLLPEPSTLTRDRLMTMLTISTYQTPLGILYLTATPRGIRSASLWGEEIDAESLFPGEKVTFQGQVPPEWTEPFLDYLREEEGEISAPLD